MGEAEPVVKRGVCGWAALHRAGRGICSQTPGNTHTQGWVQTQEQVGNKPADAGVPACLPGHCPDPGLREPPPGTEAPACPPQQVAEATPGQTTARPRSLQQMDDSQKVAGPHVSSTGEWINNVCRIRTTERSSVFTGNGPLSTWRALHRGN